MKRSVPGHIPEWERRNKAEIDLFRKLGIPIPHAAREEIERIRKHGRAEIDRMREEDGILTARLVAGEADQIPLAQLAQSAAFMALEAEPLKRRKHLAYYEGLREFVRAAKRAITAGTLIPRTQGTGIPLNLDAWCAEDETLKIEEEFMPHSRVMVKTEEARAWLEGIGTAIPPLLQPLPQIEKTTRDAEHAPAPPADAPVCETPSVPTATPRTDEEYSDRNEQLIAYVEQEGGLSKWGTADKAAKKFGISVSRLRKIVARGRKCAAAETVTHGAR